MANKLHELTWQIAGDIGKAFNSISFPLQRDKGQVVKFDTSLNTDNLGDFIIMHYCNQILDELYKDKQFVNIATHSQPSSEEEQIAKKTKFKFVCGTNLLTSHIEEHWRWRLPDGIKRKFNYRNTILLGVGWGEYQDECSVYSKMVYNCILNPNIMHSVRDHYTEMKLRQIGINNVINTGCPTTWALTTEFCETIPKEKATNVVTTITDYRQNLELDNQMLEILSRNYDHIFLWLQGSDDFKYLEMLKVPENLTIIPESLSDYEKILQKGNVDYVGTRLHAGIHALNHGIRSIIIAVDNRAIEISRDIKLPIILRKEIGEKLENKILSIFDTKIQLNQENIDLFKAQFKNRE